MMKHGLSSRIKFATEGADCSRGVMFLFEVSVQSLDESCPLTTEVTLPGFVVLVISQMFYFSFIDKTSFVLFCNNDVKSGLCSFFVFFID